MASFFDRTDPGVSRQLGHVLAATILGSSMAFIDSSVVNVALASIQSDFRSEIDVIQWVANAYLLSLGALVLLGGALGDRIGRVWVFKAGVLLFAIASAACAFSPSATILIGSRALQGIGAALMVPNSLAIIEAAFSENERGQAIGTWSGVGALTTALGPVLGGWLVDAASWRAVFFINIPIALATLWLSRDIPESNDPDAAGVSDWAGSVFMVVGLGAVTYGFISIPKLGLGSIWISASIATGVALLGAFIFVEMRSRTPIIPLRLFRSRRFSGANVLTLFLYFALSGVLFFLPYTLIRGHGYSATEAGAALLPVSLMLGLLSRQSGRFAARIGARPMLIIGPLFVAGGVALLAAFIERQSYWSGVLPGMLALGTGLTLAVAPLTTVVMGAVPSKHAGVASGINNAVARIAGLLAVAVLGLLFVGLKNETANVGADAVAVLSGFRAIAITAAACAAASAFVAAATIK